MTLLSIGKFAPQIEQKNRLTRGLVSLVAAATIRVNT